MVTARSRKTFRQLVTLPDLAIPLVETALLVACEEYPQLVLSPYLDFLDEAAGHAREQVVPGAPGEQRMIDAINQTLFGDYGFTGNASDYYDARNSFLNEVIDRRTGIPIALSTIYMALAERLDFPLEGVGVPGHFIVRHRSRDREVFIDPFNLGATLKREDVLELARGREASPAGESGRRWLGRSSHRQILARMLNNLRMIYLRDRTFDKALAMIDLMLIAEPGWTELYRQRGMLRLELGQCEDAAHDLHHYLRSQSGQDTPETREAVTRLARIRAMLN